MKKILSFLLLLMLGSCGPSKLVPIADRASKDGVLVAQKGIDTYVLLGKQADIDIRQQNIINILTVPDPAALELIVNQANPVAVEIPPRIKAYKSLIEVYRAFGLLAGGTFSDDTKTATTALENSYNGFQGIDAAFLPVFRRPSLPPREKSCKAFNRSPSKNITRRCLS